MMRLRFFGLIGLLTVLVVVFFNQLALTDLILARGDTYHYFYPYWDIRNEAFRAGEWPLWTPDIFMGAPLLANPQLGTFYPPNWLTTPFNAPDAIRYSILGHVLWAGLGAWVLFRQTVSKQFWPALLAGLIFAFSGFIGAHVEQINQLQGLAWMPWLVVLFYQVLRGERRILWILVMAMAWALQIFSGHTQTVFMTGLVLGIYALYHLWHSWRTRQSLSPQILYPLGILVLITIITLLFALPQLLPTLELAGMSNRGGGLTPQEATAFSLPPTYLGRSLLPSYDAVLFGEYVGYVGVIALGLALVGIMSNLSRTRQTQPQPTSLPANRMGHSELEHADGRTNTIKWLWLMILLVGLIFALGRFTPIYWEIAKLPGFNSFRVPARWLALVTLGVSMLAGIGLLALMEARLSRIRLGMVSIILIGLMLMGRVFPMLQVDVAGSVVATNTTLALWLLAFGLFAALAIAPLHRTRLASSLHAPLLIILVGIELFAASRVLPYNDLAPPEVYEGQRFTLSQMLAYSDETIPAGRVLSIGNWFFDPGDKADLRRRYENLGMSEEAIQTAFTAVKKQEMVSPNLPLTWGIQSVDGFGGGLLPTIYYSQFTSLLLPDGTPRTIDGRLGEILAQEVCRGACLPDLQWLALTDTRYIITDKVFDVVHEGIRYDTTLAKYWSNPLTHIVFDEGRTREFNQIRILHTGDLGLSDANTVPIENGLFITIIEGEFFTEPINGEDILAVTLVDTRADDIFFEAQPTGWQRQLSSDIKVYERVFAPPSAHLVREVATLPDDWVGHEQALQMLANGEVVSVIHADIEPPTGNVSGFVNFVEYSPTRIEINVDALGEGYLLSTDAYYPGWRATVNDEAVPVYRANVMFRAVEVPQGESTVVFEFVPTLWYNAMALGAIFWAIGGVILLAAWRRQLP